MKSRYLLTLSALLACGGAPNADQANTDSVRAIQSPTPEPPAVDSGAPRLLPIDQADSSFRAFREDALRALARHDTTFLYGMLAPTIKNSFGGDDSIAGFKRIWRMDQPNHSGVWDGLSRVLRMGGKLADSTFIAPYVYAFWPDSIDAFEYGAVTSERALIYQAPSSAESVVGTASYSILRVEEWQGMDESFVATDTSWTRVELPSNEQAWLRASDIYSPVGWRAFFERRDGRWAMTLFVAGD